MFCVFCFLEDLELRHALMKQIEFFSLLISSSIPSERLLFREQFNTDFSIGIIPPGAISRDETIDGFCKTFFTDPLKRGKYTWGPKLQRKNFGSCGGSANAELLSRPQCLHCLRAEASSPRSPNILNDDWHQIHSLPTLLDLLS